MNSKEVVRCFIVCWWNLDRIAVLRCYARREGRCMENPKHFLMLVHILLE